MHACSYEHCQWLPMKTYSRLSPLCQTNDDVLMISYFIMSPQNGSLLLKYSTNNERINEYKINGEVDTSCAILLLIRRFTFLDQKSRVIPFGWTQIVGGYVCVQRKHHHHHHHVISLLIHFNLLMTIIAIQHWYIDGELNYIHQPARHTWLSIASEFTSVKDK